MCQRRPSAQRDSSSVIALCLSALVLNPVRVPVMISSHLFLLSVVTLTQ